MNAASIAIVCAGGALGAVLRYWITLYGAHLTPEIHFPLPTLFVNITGSALLGVVFGLLGPDLLSPIEAPLLLFFGVGFCGAYTTFSSFCTEAVALRDDTNSTLMTLLYISLTIVGCVSAFSLPFHLLS